MERQIDVGEWSVKFVPISGTASDVVGIDSATRLRKTVNERRIVTPANGTKKKRERDLI